tara:strand:- start:451 stop:3153 length:2703 start_codon:yes stop_codon:yes gene_type:complete
MTSNIKDYSTTQSSNTSLNTINVGEGMLPSNLNNAIRALMKNTRDWFNDAQWIEYGDGSGAYTAAYASATSFTINGSDVTAIYHAGRRIKLTASSPGTIFGTISSSSFSSNTTVNVTWDSGSLSNEAITNVYIGALSKTNNSIPTDILGAANLQSNSVTTIKIADDAVTNAKIADNAVQASQINSNAVTEAKINASAVTTTKIADTAITTAKITDANVTAAKLASDSVTTAKIADDAVTIAKIADAAIVTSSEQASHTPDNNTFYTTSASDTRFLNKDTSELINSGNTWSASDDFIATTAAIDARVIDLVDDVGGFFPIANETSFPNTNPDVNDGAGTIVSIKEIASTRTPSGGTVSISGGTVGGSTVTINGCGSTVLTAGFGVLVETTTTLNTYTFHRLSPKATEVSTVASVSTEIGRLGTADAVSDMNTLGTTQNVSDMNTLAAISGLNTLASNSANVTTVANNLSSVNNFAEVYRIASSAPTDSLNVGDLYFDTTANELKVYKSSGWAAAGSTVNGTSARFKYTASANQTTFTGSDDNGNTLAYDAGFIDCYLNGVKLVNGTDVTVTSGTSVVLASGATAGDILDLVGFGTFNVAAIAATSITSGTLADARLPSTMASKTLTGANVTTVYNGLVAGGDGGSNDGQIQLNCSQNSHGVKIKAPPHSAGQSYTLTLPSSITNNYYLKTDGSGNLSFAEVPTETKPTVANVAQTIAPATATTINITGTNFSGIPRVEFIKSDGSVTTANTVSLTNATTLSVNATLALGNYYVRIELDDGNSGRSANAIITASTAPSFSTNAGSLGTIAGNFSGTVATIAGSSDSTIAFSETTSVLTNASQANCTLNSATGVITTSDFGGSSTTPTTYTFTIRITDAEGQTADREFSLTSSFGATGGGQFN